MQLLLASDLHYNLRQLDWVMDRAREVDAVVLAGDLLDVASAVPLETQIVALQAYVGRLAEQTRVIVCSGNHDLTGRNQHDEKWAPWITRAELPAAVVDGERLDVDSLRITVCPWWDGPATRLDVAAQLAGDGEDRPRRWIWIYHYPPDESPVSWSGRRHIGDRDLNQWIDRHEPDLVLTGHIHHAPFVDGGSWIDRIGSTWVINAGVQPGDAPPNVLIDCEAGTARWWSPYGRDDCQLWEPASQA
ncbi:MAG: metallophosphoesterase [Actinomycetota bacterium]